MVGPDFALAVTAACTESVAEGNLDVAVLLFALIGFCVLNAFYMQVARICLYAFADDLRTFEGCIPPPLGMVICPAVLPTWVWRWAAFV